MKTMQQLACDALMVQNASNIHGVVNGLRRAMDDLSKHVSGSDAVANHPVTRLFVTQIMHLSGMGMADLDTYQEAHDECQRLAKGPDVE